MPMCSIKQCGARKSKNRPNLTLHSVPKNEVLRRKWLKAIGLENINPRHKELYICSLHFEESHLNRTLDVVRLRENAVPTVFNMPSTSKHMIYTQNENLDPSPRMPPITEPVPVLCDNVNLPEKHLDTKKKPEEYYLYIFKFFVEFYGFDNQKVLATGNVEQESTPRPWLNEDISSQSSEEKMDTDSTQSRQLTPNSNSSEYEDPDQGLDGTLHVLRLQNPKLLVTSDVNGSLITNMNNLKMDRPQQLTVSPKFSSTLISTTNHPLMGLGSPDENYPDLIPKKHQDDKDLSLSSIEDCANDTNGFYSPQRNTSKNNLYFNENFITADSFSATDVISPPDVARGIEKRKRFDKDGKGKGEGLSRLDALKGGSHSTPKRNEALDISEAEEFHTGVADWCESPSQLRSMPNFDLPIELKTTIPVSNELDSPDVISSSTQEDRSSYQALLDPHTGSVALRHTGSAPSAPRRRIQLPPEDDQLSADSASDLEASDEPPGPGSGASADPESRRSTNTLSDCSEPIPEYSAADELRDERSWLSVPRAGPKAVCDMKVIEPYKRVVSHGGYDAGGSALIVFSACHLPDVARADYHYCMDNLFLYVIWTLERLVTDEYVLIYLYGSAGPRRLPTIHWLREYYKLIDHRLRKSLKHLYLVHPTYGLKIFVAFTKAFVSSKFFRKLTYVRNLTELMGKVPVEPNAIPELVKQYDAGRR